MQTSITKKQTITRKSVTWAAKALDDDSNIVATFTATLNGSGENFTKTIQNQTLYETNKDAVQELYAQFISDFQSTTADITAVKTETETE